MNIRSPRKQGCSRRFSREHCRNAHCSRTARETRIAVTGATEVCRALCAPGQQRLGPFEIACAIQPARFVGGDFVCSFQQDGKTILVLGDLMGKGLSAAMWVTHSVDLVRRAAEGSQNLEELLARLNMEVLNSRIRAPLTSAIALSIDEESGVISCASAGHPPALVLRQDASSAVTTAGGPLLGAFPNARYDSQELFLAKGEALIAFSDGVIEASNDNHEEFAIERVKAVAIAGIAATAGEKAYRLLRASTAFAGENVLDDISIVVVQRD